MPFRIALSGLNAASAGLRTTANNIANASTTGFRQSRTEFASLFPNTGSTAGAAGGGVRVSRNAQQFAQGNFRFTDNALDAGIGGEGFFVLSDGGTRLYTRAGEFSVDAEGYVVNPQGSRLQAYPVGSNGQFNTGAPTDLRLAAGRVTRVSVDQTGVVTAYYSDGQSTSVGKVTIADFTNPQGLQQVGDTVWAESSASGAATLGEAGTASFGLIQTGAVESSNVDLTEQLVEMIRFARQFETQASVIRTADENAATLTNMLADRKP